MSSCCVCYSRCRGGCADAWPCRRSCWRPWGSLRVYTCTDALPCVTADGFLDSPAAKTPSYTPQTETQIYTVKDTNRTNLYTPQTDLHKGTQLKHYKINFVHPSNLNMHINTVKNTNRTNLYIPHTETLKLSQLKN